MKDVLLWLWQLPQNLIGLLLSLCSKERELKFAKDGEIVELFYMPLFGSGVSLGNYIVFDTMYYTPLKYSKEKINDVNHEHGHQKQSRILGPFYFIVIGIPSLIGNLIDRIFHMGSEWYYKQPWEAWADKLGGVERG